MKKILLLRAIIAVLIVSFLGILPAQADVVVSGVWRDLGTYILPANNKDVGASSDRVANGYFTNLNVSGTCTGCGTGGSGGSISSETPVGTINGSNTTFTVSNSPTFETVNGQVLTQNNGYTLSSLTITYSVAPVSGSVLASFYNTSTGGSGVSRSIISTSTSTTMLAVAGTDYVYLVTSTSTTTPVMTLPTSVSNTNQYTVKNVGVGAVLINAASSQTMDGSSTTTLSSQYQSDDFISNNSNWNIK